MQSFCDAPVGIIAPALGAHSTIRNIATGATVSGEAVPLRRQGTDALKAKRTSFILSVVPHSFVVLAEE